MKKAYQFQPRTGEYIRCVDAQKNPKGEDLYFLPQYCTFVEPPSFGEKEKPVWNGESWLIKEDHRRKLNAKGQYEGGTPFWIPKEGDNYKSDPRYMTTLGPLPEGAVTERPERTEDEKKKEELDKAVMESRALLNSTDYRILKFMDSYISSLPEMKAKFEATYPDTLSDRANARAIINESEQTLQNMN